MKRYSKPEYQGSRLRQMVENTEKSMNLPVREVSPLPQAHRLNSRLSPKTCAELVQAYRDGVGTPTLRKRYGLSQGSVLKVLRDHGVTMRPNGTNQHSDQQ